MQTLYFIPSQNQVRDNAYDLAIKLIQGTTSLAQKIPSVSAEPPSIVHLNTCPLTIGIFTSLMLGKQGITTSGTSPINRIDHLHQ